jgi:predicted homoserine dehydrogenase-like protein
MMITDNLLQAREREGRPIRVGMIGAGFMAQGLVNTIENSVPGMRVVAIYGRRLERALERLQAEAEQLPSLVVDDDRRDGHSGARLSVRFADTVRQTRGLPVHRW